MQASADIPVLRPTRGPPIDHQVSLDSIKPPPPVIDSNQPSAHQRARTEIKLPPLHTRQRSKSPSKITKLLPSLKSRPSSPERVTSRVLEQQAAEFDLNPGLGATSAGQTTNNSGRLASWFIGSSDPVNISFVPSPTKEMPDPIFEYPNMRPDSSSSVHCNLTRRPSHKSSRSVSSNLTPAAMSLMPPPTSKARLAFSSFFKTRTAPTETVPADELLNIDVEKALSLPDDESPVALLNLRIVATDLLKKFQNAYRDVLQSRDDVMAEKLAAIEERRTALVENTALADELEAARTRAEHLKIQLEIMAERDVAREVELQSTKQELDRMRRLAQGTLRRVPTEQQEEPSRRRMRVSDVSSLMPSEDGSEATSAESVFSEAAAIQHSPATSFAGSPEKPRLDDETHSSLPPELPRSEAWYLNQALIQENHALRSLTADADSIDSVIKFIDELRLLKP